MGERETGLNRPGRGPSTVPVLALSQVEFAESTREALREFHHLQALADNPLMRSRALRDRAGDQPHPEDLRDLLGEAIDSLRADSRDEKLHRALARTYVRPARTQELAAEALGLPFSTYRRHLTKGIERVVDWLWQRELYPEASEQRMTWRMSSPRPQSCPNARARGIDEKEDIGARSRDRR